MNTVALATEAPVKKEMSVIGDLAQRHGMLKEHFVAALKATVVPANVTDAQFAAFCMVAAQYNLNPITKEIYAFPARSGGIQPIVSIDGWCNIINSNPNLDGIQFIDHMTDGKLTAITCKISRKDRAHPIECIEYMEECKRDTDPWKKWPARMLRHKALMQCARYAFSLSGIVDQDEAERMDMVDVTPLVVDPKTGELVKGGRSPFKTAKARSEFYSGVKSAIESASNSKELDFIKAAHKVQLDALRMSAAENDQITIDDLELCFDMAENKFELAEKLSREADSGNFDVPEHMR